MELKNLLKEIKDLTKVYPNIQVSFNYKENKIIVKKVNERKKSLKDLENLENSL